MCVGLWVCGCVGGCGWLDVGVWVCLLYTQWYNMESI